MRGAGAGESRNADFIRRLAAEHLARIAAWQARAAVAPGDVRGAGGGEHNRDASVEVAAELVAWGTIGE